MSKMHLTGGTRQMGDSEMAEKKMGMRDSESAEKKGGININPANKGKFTAKASAAGMGVQGYAAKVMAAPPGKYPPALRKEANFARNAKKFKH